MLFYLSMYVAGMLLGLAASQVFDVQLRRPGSRQAVGLVIFAALLWGFVTITQTRLADLLLPLLWVGTGLLAGLGSRAPRAPG